MALVALILIPFFSFAATPADYQIVVPYRILKIEQLQQSAHQANQDNQKALDITIRQMGSVRKQAAAKEILQQFGAINNSWVSHNALVLSQLDAVLEKTQSRAGKMAAEGTDVSSVSKALLKASTAIDNAEKALEIQATKTYALDNAQLTVQGDIQSQLKTAFQKKRADLYRDLSLLRDGPMKDARVEVEEAVNTVVSYSHP
jgi:hypothetical protein